MLLFASFCLILADWVTERSNLTIADLRDFETSLIEIGLLNVYM
jgi:hypothetical protein